MSKTVDHLPVHSNEHRIALLSSLEAWFATQPGWHETDPTYVEADDSAPMPIYRIRFAPECPCDGMDECEPDMAGCRLRAPAEAADAGVEPSWLGPRAGLLVLWASAIAVTSGIIWLAEWLAASWSL